VARSRSLYLGDGFRIGELLCPPGDGVWDEELCDNDPILCFPETGVWVVEDLAVAAVADTNEVRFHSPGRPYRLRLLDPRGYACSFLALEASLVTEIARSQGRSVDDPVHPFLASSSPVDQRGFLLKHQLLVHLRSGGPVDRLFVEEHTLRLLGGCLAEVAHGHEPPDSGRLRSSTRSTRAATVEAVKAELGLHEAENLSLHDLARIVHSSPYHLARVFREHAGRSIHAYRNDLRLRRSLALVADPTKDLGTIGVELGFSSPGHFTKSFRRMFGSSPSEVRRAASTNGSAVDEIGTNLPSADPPGRRIGQ
jgi:AraC family transcriptional regulator